MDSLQLDEFGLFDRLNSNLSDRPLAITSIKILGLMMSQPCPFVNRGSFKFLVSAKSLD